MSFVILLSQNMIKFLCITDLPWEHWRWVTCYIYHDGL